MLPRYQKKQTVFKKIGYQLSLRIAGLIIVNVQTVFLIKVLSIEDFGEFSYFQAVINILSVLGMFGFPQLMQKDLRQGKAVKFLFVDFIIFLIVGLMPLYLVLIGTDLLVETQIIGWSIILAIISNSILRVNSHYLFGRGLLKLGQLIDTVSRPAIFLLVIVFVWYQLDGDLDFSTTAVVFSVCCLVATVSSTLFLRKNQNILAAQCEKQKASDRTSNKYLLNYIRSVPFFIISGIQIASINIWVILVAHETDSEQVATFRVAFLIGALVALLREVIDITLRNQLIHSETAEKSTVLSSAKSANQIYLRFSMLLFAGLVLYYFVGAGLLVWFLGSEYNSVFIVATPLLVARLVELMFGPWPALLQFNGFEKALIYISALSLLSSLVFYFAFPADNIAFAAASSYLIFVFLYRILAFLYFRFSICERKLC